MSTARDAQWVGGFNGWVKPVLAGALQIHVAANTQAPQNGQLTVRIGEDWRGQRIKELDRNRCTILYLDHYTFLAACFMYGCSHLASTSGPN